MWLVTLFLAMATGTPICKNAVTEQHLHFFDDLIDSQLQSSCTITFDFVDQEQLTDEVCYIQAAFEFLNTVLDTHMNFKEGSRNFNTTEEVKKLHEFLLLEHCITTPEKGCCKQCAKTFTVSPQEMLELVKAVFRKTQKLLQNRVEMQKDCTKQFEQCRSQQLPPTTGPAQCDCSYLSLQNLRRGESTFLLTTSSNWEHLPNAPSAAPTTMPAWQGSKGIRDTSTPPKDLPDTAYTPVAISDTEFRDSSSGQGSFKTPGQSVRPSFESIPQGQDVHDFNTESPSVHFTLVPDTTGHSSIWNSGSKNLMSGSESVGATAMAQTVGRENHQSISPQAVFGTALHSSSTHRTSGEGSGDKATVQKFLLSVSSMPENNGPPLAPGVPSLASRKNENPAKESSASWKVTPPVLEQLMTKARPPIKQHSKGGGESAERFNEREEQFAGPRSESYSFSDTGEGKVQGRGEPESRRTAFLSSALPVVAGLSLLTLCGLLYYRRKSKLLERTLRATQPEERPLNEELVELQVQGIV